MVVVSRCARCLPEPLIEFDRHSHGRDNNAMNVQELKKRLSGGFRPFAIRTTDGQEFAIPHPEFLLIGKYSIAVRDKEGFINTLDPLHIVSARELSRRNGGS